MLHINVKKMDNFILNIKEVRDVIINKQLKASGSPIKFNHTVVRFSEDKECFVHFSTLTIIQVCIPSISCWLVVDLTSQCISAHAKHSRCGYNRETVVVFTTN